MLTLIVFASLFAAFVWGRAFGIPFPTVFLSGNHGTHTPGSGKVESHAPTPAVPHPDKRGGRVGDDTSKLTAETCAYQCK